MNEQTFRHLLRTLRRARGLTQEELAERAGLSARAVSDLERGVKQRPHRETVRLLADALGLDPRDRETLQASVNRVRRDSIDPAPAVARPRNNLPHPTSSFLGREAEVAQILSLFGTDGARLLTLTGPGGAGKTRLALRAALDMMGEFPDGVYFVPLAGIDEVGHVTSGLARALEVVESSELPLEEALARHLAEKRLLLILDNFEHVVDAAPLVSELLHNCEFLCVLVTSRRRLNLSGEFEMVVPPLSLPDRERLDVKGDLTAYEAVALFEQRARAAYLGFRLSSENAPAVAQLCARLDGLPLAIELAAVHVRTLPPQAILSRLSHRLDLLQQGPRDAPERHRALRATMDWSYDLLDTGQQATFRRLGAFAGGCSLQAAQAVAGTHEESGTVLSRLEELRDHSLIQIDTALDEPRLRMLETIREYAGERLRASGEHKNVEQRHAEWYLRLGRRAGDAIRRTRDPSMLALLERERDNVRLVLERALSSGDAETAGALAGSIAPFWRIRCYFREGERWLSRILERVDELTQETRAHVSLGACEIAFALGEYDRAASMGREALRIFRELPNPWGATEALNRLGLIAWEQGDPEAAIALHEECLGIRRANGDLAGTGASLGNLGTVAHSRGDLAAARQYFEQSIAVLEGSDDVLTLAIEQGNLGAILMDSGELDAADRMFRKAQESFQTLGDASAETFIVSNRGLLALARDDPPEARRLLEEALATCRTLEEPQNEARTLYCLADVALYEGNSREALPLAAEALEIFARLDHGQGTVFTLEAIACALAESDPRAALRAFGAAEHLREENAVTLVDAELKRHERYLAAAVAAVRGDEIPVLLAQGRDLSRAEAVRQALETVWEGRVRR